MQKGTTKEPHAKYLPNFQYTELNNHNLNSKYVIRNTYVTAPSIPHALSYSQQSSQPSNLIITKSKSPQIQFNSILSPTFKTSNANWFLSYIKNFKNLSSIDPFRLFVYHFICQRVLIITDAFLLIKSIISG